MTRHDRFALRRYLRAVKGWLPCSARQKKQILTSIESSVTGFLTNNPNSDFTAIEKQFGTPQEIASSYVDDMGTPELLKALRIRKRILVTVSCVAIATALAILLSWGYTVAWAVHQFNAIQNGYIVEEMN